MIAMRPLELIREPAVSVDITEGDRAEAPSKCPECGGPLEYADFFGEWFVHGPSDRRLLAKNFGLEVGDRTWVLWAGCNAICRDEDSCGWQSSMPMA